MYVIYIYIYIYIQYIIYMIIKPVRIRVGSKN